MKQLINIGTAVDTGTGDYLLEGARKINNNFEEIYTNLGDGSIIHSSEVYKKIGSGDLKGGIYFPVFGQSLALDSSEAQITLQLPKGSIETEGMTIRLVDVFRSWADRPIEVKPASGDTIKGSTGTTIFHRNLSHIVLFYTKGGRWEYVETTQIDQHRADDLRSVVMKEFVAYEGQVDFPEPFGVDRYNPDGLEVYRRGNRLYYGDFFNENSEYGSIDEKTGELIALDGKTLKLRYPCKEGDTIALTSYIDGIETFRTSFSSRTFEIYNPLINKDTTFRDNVLLIGDDRYTESDNDITYIELRLKDDLNIQSYDNLNPYSTKIMLNGVLLSKMEDIGGEYYCEGVENSSDIKSPSLCSIKGGVWKPYERSGDYNFVYEGSKVVAIELNFKLDHKDILTIEWFNNIIVAGLSIDDIRTELDDSFFSSVDSYTVSHSISIPEYEDIEGIPNQADIVHDQTVKNIRPNTLNQVLEMIYPIGHIYTNLYNKESPELTLGFGKWRRMSGYVLAGFDDDYSNIKYGQNNSFLDSGGKATPTTGGTIGQESIVIHDRNIPHVEIDTTVLVKDKDGNIDIGACLAPPDMDTSTLNRKYREDKLEFGMSNDQLDEIEIIQPTMIVSMWVRVA